MVPSCFCFKVFEYFASFKVPGGEVYMTPGDLMRAVVPVFPPSEADSVRGGSLKGEKVPGELHCAPSKFFMLFDTNNDGLISFPELVLLLHLAWKKEDLISLNHFLVCLQLQVYLFCYASQHS